ncbi:unnamed protein product [Pleuronectes platessa]|uniref:Uncharacterized protein n=1 Tax=Pleuronectes platessa TaxID=8262 RepID=A0A9N7U4K9_PLEPL|nr:unnamed protein product [Pleuronectes platessa]
MREGRREEKRRLEEERRREKRVEERRGSLILSNVFSAFNLMFMQRCVLGTDQCEGKDSKISSDKPVALWETLALSQQHVGCCPPPPPPRLDLSLHYLQFSLPDPPPAASAVTASSAEA